MSGRGKQGRGGSKKNGRRQREEAVNTAVTQAAEDPGNHGDVSSEEEDPGNHGVSSGDQGVPSISIIEKLDRYTGPIFFLMDQGLPY